MVITDKRSRELPLRPWPCAPAVVFPLRVGNVKRKHMQIGLTQHSLLPIPQ